jgi:hypothetical protein
VQPTDHQHHDHPAHYKKWTMANNIKDHSDGTGKSFFDLPDFF